MRGPGGASAEHGERRSGRADRAAGVGRSSGGRVAADGCGLAGGGDARERQEAARAAMARLAGARARTERAPRPRPDVSALRGWWSEERREGSRHEAGRAAAADGASASRSDVLARSASDHRTATAVIGGRGRRAGRRVTVGLRATATPSASLEARERRRRRLSDGLGAAGDAPRPRGARPATAPLRCAAAMRGVTEGAAVGVPDDRKGPVSIVRVGDALSPNVEAKPLTVPACTSRRAGHGAGPWRRRVCRGARRACACSMAKPWWEKPRIPGRVTARCRSRCHGGLSAPARERWRRAWTRAASTSGRRWTTR